jgi:hypothetical protein
LCFQIRTQTVRMRVQNTAKLAEAEHAGGYEERHAPLRHRLREKWKLLGRHHFVVPVRQRREKPEKSVSASSSTFWEEVSNAPSVNLVVC